MDGYTQTSSSSIGAVLVEQDGVFHLQAIDRINIGTRTAWGVFAGVSVIENEFYYTYSQQHWNDQLEQYEESIIRIAVSALVHPRTQIHPDVIIEPRAIVSHGVELLTGARVTSGKTIPAGQRFHHLMGESPTNSAAA